MKKKIQDPLVIPKQPTLKLKSVSLDEVVMGKHYLMLIDGHYYDGSFNNEYGLKFHIGIHWIQVFYDGTKTEFGGIWELFPDEKVVARVKRRKARSLNEYKRKHPELFKDEE